MEGKAGSSREVAACPSCLSEAIRSCQRGAALKSLGASDLMLDLTPVAGVAVKYRN